MLNDILINGKSFVDGNKTYCFDHDIDMVIRLDDVYIVMFMYDQVWSNVDAYDIEGNHLWNIHDIIDYDDTCVLIGIEKDLENCIFVTFYAGIAYTIDIKKREVISKVITK